MAALPKVSQSSADGNCSTAPQQIPFSIAIPRSGVVTLFGYGIKVTISQGHLTLDDGIGPNRRHIRCPRVGHGLKRLVVIGSDGVVSLSALRWLAEQDVAFAMLDRDGAPLCTTGPVRPSDARLRRAQALARYTGADITVARELISRKIDGQARVIQHGLRDDATAQRVAQFQNAVANATSLDEIRVLESRAAAAYWNAWSAVPVTFPRSDQKRVPDHWRVFAGRTSQLTQSPRLATNPPNAMLNYLYAVLESESRLALAALGLDPGLGVLHLDTTNRDSLACDLMEAARPQVDAFVLSWITREPLKKEWFFENHDGNCRLAASFAMRLSQTADTWRRAVAPVAEWVAQTIWSTTKHRVSAPVSPTRLTQSRKRAAKGSTIEPPAGTPQPESVCRICGKTVDQGREHCADCHRLHSGEHMTAIARRGRVAAQSAEAQAKRANTQRSNALARLAWNPASNPPWLSEQTYRADIQPHLGNITVRALAAALGVSIGYAADVRAGRRRPHCRHWQSLAELVGVLQSTAAQSKRAES